MSAEETIAHVIAAVVRAALAPVVARLELLEARALVAGPAGRDGVDGAPGAPGAPGRDGAAGAPGRDGLGFEDLEWAEDAVGRLEARFVRGERVATVRLPGLVYRDTYREGTAYEKGDAVTWGGGIWIAGAATTAKPGQGATPWRLAVKAGRDGRGGRP
jgi:integrin beta 3